MCDYSDMYLVLKGAIDLLAAAGSENEKACKDVTFKNNARFRWSISKISSTLIGNAGDCNIVMPMYNLLEYNDLYSVTSWSLWNCHRDEVNDASDNLKRINDLSIR